MLTGGIRHEEMRRRNRWLVIAAIRQAGKPSRTEISGLTGLSQSTISAIAADLIEEGIMLETGHDTNMDPPRRGRPQVALQLNPEVASAVCLYLSFNQLSATLVNYNSDVIQSTDRHLSTLTMNRDDLIDATVEAVRNIIDGHENVMRIVFAVQGITDATGNEMLWSPILAHDQLALGPALTETFGLPVSVQNDCNMIARALRWKNSKRYGDNFLALLLSHGIGMGLMLNGKVFTGTRSSGGEFGHITHKPYGALCRCGRRGCIEAYAGSYAIRRRAYGESIFDVPLSDNPLLDMEELLKQAKAGEALALQAFREAGEAIGFGLGSLFSLIDPAPVALIGHGTSAFEFLEPEIRLALAQTAGGQNAADIRFEVWPDEIPLVQLGCAIEALNSIDHDVFGPGL